MNLGIYQLLLRSFVLYSYLGWELLTTYIDIACYTLLLPCHSYFRSLGPL